VLSRRQFLQFAGITLLGSTLPGFALAEDTVTQHYGRTLAAAPVYHHPNTQAQPLHHLWPDSVVSLTEVSSSWYRNEAGFIPRQFIQPVSLPIEREEVAELPCWAEVTAPVAPVWGWCSASAPLITRIGHGGAAQVIDALPDWMGIADEKGELLGWSQTSHWGAVRFNRQPAPVDLVIANSQLTVFQHNRAVAQLPVSLGQLLPAGKHPLTQGNIGGMLCCPQPEQRFHGASWQLRFGNDYDITSVYWHNRFGEPVPGPDVQITPIMGRWLYEMAAEGSTITIQHNA
jgi:hypothetical protein